MKQLAVLVSLLSISLALSGCASTSSGKVAIGSISDLPQTMLNGAELDDARAVAMGTARTKGWTIKDAAANRLLLERELSNSSPQATALGSSLTPPTIEVETDLVERSEGTVVALKAFVVTNPGTQEEKRIDYTSDYENQLLISLSSLQSAWLSSRNKIASKVPLPSEQDAEEQSQSQNDPSVAEPVVAGTPDSPGLSSADASPVVAEPSSAPPPQLSSAPTATEAPDLGVAQTTSALPEASGGGLPSTATSAAPVLTEPAPRNDMLVLNSSSRKGLWAYYAEDYARLRGCAIGDRGAVLMQETPTFELHEVECAGSSNMLLKCQGGVCNAVQ
ncbi:MAG: hypothetical protein WBG92_18290 [Thiohalocapsa sp.]